MQCLISYGNLISINLIKNKFPEYKRINSQKDIFFNLLFDFINNNYSNDENIISNKQNEMVSHDELISNQPISYNWNKESFFYFHQHNFFDFFRVLKL